jgi:hypothetical protein
MATTSINCEVPKLTRQARSDTPLAEPKHKQVSRLKCKAEERESAHEILRTAIPDREAGRKAVSVVREPDDREIKVG